MAVTTTKTDLTRPSSEMPKKHNVYDNFDQLKSVVLYDVNQNVDYILKGTVNDSGKFLQTKKYVQVQVDVVQAPTNVNFDAARLRARIYRNEGSKVYETGFIYWVGNPNQTMIGKTEYGNVLSVPTILKGNFSKDISSLQDNATYNYRAYVKHEYGTNYSKVYQFNTLDFNSVFSIAGDRFSGPAPLTVNLSAINAGTAGYTYGWNITGGPISFEYSVSGITITSMGSGYEPELPRYILETIQITSSGAGYEPTAETLVLVNNTITPLLTASFAYNSTLAVYGISSVEIAYPLSGYTNNTLIITFSSSDLSSVTETASGVATTGSYTIPREFAVFIDNILQPSLSVLNVYNAELDTFQISAIDVPSEIFGFTNSSRTVSISTTDAVPDPATAVATGNIQILADYITKDITHTYLSAGTFTVKAYAILGDQIEKEASRTIRANQTTNFTAEWSPVINSSFGNSIVGAYDFRNLAGGLDAIGLNEKCFAFFDFEQEGATGGYNSAPGVQQQNKIVGGYSHQGTLERDPNPIFIGGFIGGYSVQNGIGGYWGTLGEGILGGYAAKFVSQVGGYGVDNRTSWYGFQNYSFVPSGNLSISLWVNYPQFWNEPGSKIFSFFNQKEFGVTQSTTRLSIFKNYSLAEQSGDITAGGYNGSFGYPIMTTTDSSKMLVAGQWNHMVITRDAANNYKYYLNGQLALSAQSDFLSNSSTFGGFIGGYGALNLGSSRIEATLLGSPSGCIDAVGLWNKVLNATDIDVLYNAGQGFEDVGIINPIVGPKLYLGGIGGYTNTTFITDGDSEWDKTSLFIKFEGSDGSTDFVDSSQYNVPLSASPVNAIISTDEFKYGSSSGRFLADGSYNNFSLAGYIVTPAGDDYAAFENNDFTIEWWEYLFGVAHPNRVSGYRGIFSYGNPNMFTINRPGNSTPYAQFGLSYWDGQADTRLRVFIGGYPRSNGDTVGGYAFNMNLGADDLEYNNWTHRAFVKNGTDYYFYKNGILQASAPVPGGNSLRIGSANIGGYGEISTTFNNNWATGYGSGVGVIGTVFSDSYSGEDARIYPLSGYLDDFRITKGFARYTQNFTPPTMTFPDNGGTGLLGTQFTPNFDGSFAETKSTIQVNYPHTIVFIGQADSTGNDVIYQAAQPVKWGQTPFQNVLMWSRPFQGLLAYNGNDNQAVGYTPDNSEYFYAAFSFLGSIGGYTVRYHVQTPTVSLSGTLPANTPNDNFNGFIGFGQGLSENPWDPRYDINGTARLGMFINQGFSTHEDMLTLFDAITSGPASNVTLT
jgi:hypothetical protein